MAFRVRTTTKAKRDLDAILARLLSQEAGEAGLRWFQGLREAVASLAHSPQRCALAPENAVFPLRYGTCFTDASRMCTAFFSPSKAIRFLSCTSATDAASPSPSIDGKAPRRGETASPVWNLAENVRAFLESLPIAILAIDEAARFLNGALWTDTSPSPPLRPNHSTAKYACAPAPLREVDMLSFAKSHMAGRTATSGNA